MNVIQRIGLRMAGIPENLAAKALSLRSPYGWDKVGANPLGQGGQFNASDDGLVGAVRSNVWAYNCVKARMTMVATPKLKLYKGEGDDKTEVESHPVLDLLRTVNPINLNARSFLRGIEQQLSIFGRCVIHKNRGTSAPVELYILPKTYVEVIADPKTFIGGYRWLPTGEIINPKDIIDIFYPAADGSVDAESPAAIALGAINRYNIADRAQTAIDKRGGQKGGMVIHPENEIDEDFQRVKDEWDRRRADPDKAGADMHVPHGTEYEGDAFSSAELQREERIQRLTKEIMAGFNIPPASAGDYTDASVLANAAVQMKAAWDLFGLEELNFIAEGLTNNLLWPEYKDAAKSNYYFAFDTSTINALSEDLDARVNRAGQVYSVQIASLNEAREMAGLPPIPDPKADKVPMAADMAQPEPMPAPTDMAPVDPLPTDAPIQQTALNGAQISSLVEVVQAVSKNELPVESAVEIVKVSFPNIDEDTVATMIEAAVKSPEEVAVEADQAEVDALGSEVDDLLSQIDTPSAKALGKPEKGDRDGDGIFNEGAKVSPVTGRSLAAPAPEEKPKKAKKAPKSEAQKEQERQAKEQEKQAKAEAKKKAQIDKLDEEGTKLQAAYDSIKDRPDVSPKLKQKVIDTLAKVKAKRDSLATGQSEATSSVLQDIARIPTKAIPILDPVGRMALDLAGAEIGKIEKVARFNVHNGIEATADDPVVYIAGQVFKASTVRMVVDG